MAYIGNDLQVAYQSYQIIDDISSSFNGSTTSFALLVGGVPPVPFPINEQQCLISVGGVIQEPDPTGTNGFRFSGGNIVFSSAPGSGEDFFGVILAGADYVNVGVNYPSGSVSAPSITFDTDLDTGIYNPAANELGLVTNGSDAIRIDSSGSLLMGTSTALTGAVTRYSKLVVQGNSAIATGPAFLSAARGETAATIASADQTIGRIDFTDSGAGQFATISCITDAAVGLNDYPSRLVFSTAADGASSPIERMRITSDGTIRLINSTGIDFSQIQTNAAGMTSETLDSYEEGTWTPVICGVTPTIDNAFYTKIGRLVIVKARVNVITPPSGSSSEFNITGLPFVGSVINGYNGFLVGYTSNHNWPGNLNGGVTSFFPEIRLFIAGSTNTWTINDYIAIRGANDTLEFQCTYFV